MRSQTVLCAIASLCACPGVDPPAPNDDAGVLVDAGPTDFEFCNDLSVAECQVVGCRRASAVSENDSCGNRDVERIPLACIPAPPDEGCGDAVTCAVRPEDGVRFAFSDTCTPPGWEECRLCENFELCETVESEFEVCIDETATDCDSFYATLADRWLAIRAASDACTNDFDCTTELANFRCGEGEVFVGSCPVPVAHEQVCAFRQAHEDLEVELCTPGCVPGCVSVPQCLPPAPLVCVDGHCAFGK